MTKQAMTWPGALYAGLMLIVTLGLSACGDGNSSSAPAPNPISSTTLSGTAATGAPMIGQVTVKDANGVMRTTDIRLDGTYTVDVDGLTAPFLLRAQGTVGGREIRLVSAASEADVGGTINITPFTDLIIANIAGQVAEQFFDNPTNVAGLVTPAALDTARQQLTTRLLLILTALGVDSSFDLLRTAFAADHTGFDAVMDVLKVTVDPQTATAEIRDIVNNTSITDSFSIQETDTIPPPTADIMGTLSAVEQVRLRMGSFIALFATGSPSESALSPYFSTGFLEDGRDLETTLFELTTDPEVVGLTINSVSLQKTISAQELVVLVQATDATGGTDSWEDTWRLENGAWRLAGNGLPIDTNARAVNHRSYWNGSWHYSRHLDVWIDYAPPEVFFVKTVGPGLPTTGVLQQRDISLHGFEIVLNANGTVTGSTSGSWVNECGEQQDNAPCIDFSNVPNNAEYTISYYDQNMTPLTLHDISSYVLVMPRPPFTNAEAAAGGNSWFGLVTGVTPQDYTSFVLGTNITFNITAPTATGFQFNDVSLYTNEVQIWDETLVNGVASVTWGGDNAPTACDPPWINLWLDGPLGRKLHSNRSYSDFSTVSCVY